MHLGKSWVTTAAILFAVAIGCWIGTVALPNRADTHGVGPKRAQGVQSARTETPQAPSATTGDSGKNEVREIVNQLPKKFPVLINQPEGPPVIELDVLDPQGRKATMACSSCHSQREPDHENRTSADLSEFHQGLEVIHGNLSCLSCHNPSDYDTLRLADGSTVEYRDVMQLCSQCHGPQATSFANGAHGGMTGYWDRTRGPQMKNNCVDCHDPHQPAFPKMIPTFKPKDRFLSPVAPDESH